MIDALKLTVRLPSNTETRSGLTMTACSSSVKNVDRRRFMAASAGVVATFSLPIPRGFGHSNPHRLVASLSKAALVMDRGPATQVWAFNGMVPGPLLRYRQGDTLSLEVENQLPQPTTVHWHGLRVPIGMDGVPYLSQEPIRPGESFHYEFELQDAGTFWYHPHFSSSEQVGRGLHGVLIVDEDEPVPVDRDVVWVLDDWRLNQAAQILPFEPNMRDSSHNGRVGNVVTVNGEIDEVFAVYSGERLRLRLVNVANARTFALDFQQLVPWIVAFDGHPVDPRRTDGDLVVVGAGQRVDLILDIPDAPNAVDVVIDRAYGDDFAYELMRLVRSEGWSKSRQNSAPKRLMDNPVVNPDLAAGVERFRVVLEGGAMGTMTGATVGGERKTIRELVGLGKAWALNGVVSDDAHSDPPLFTLRLGESYIFEIENRTAWEHPVHLHGHSFQVISRNSETVADSIMRDTVLLQPEERVEIAFVADNPGRWMFHCHILEHQSSGMTSVVEVA